MNHVIARLNVIKTADFLARVLIIFIFAPLNLSAENIFLCKDGKFRVREGKAVVKRAEFKIYAGKVIFVKQLHDAVKFGLTSEQDKNFMLEFDKARHFLQKKFGLPLKTRDVGGGNAD